MASSGAAPSLGKRPAANLYQGMHIGQPAHAGLAHGRRKDRGDHDGTIICRATNNTSILDLDALNMTRGGLTTQQD